VRQGGALIKRGVRGSELVLRSRLDLAMEASTVEVKGRALVLLLAVEEKGRLATLISGCSG
jgi:hypothetical protein